MLLLIIGLLVFLGIHSIHFLAPGWRQQMVQRLGSTAWKVAFSIASLVGLLLIIYGYGQARTEPIWLWYAPVWTRHLAALLTLPAVIFLAAACVPGNRLRVKLGHPAFLGIKLWAFAHLLANGSLADLLLFGGFLVWAIVGYAVLRRRDRLAGVTRGPGKLSADIVTLVVGVIGWAVIAFYLHALLIGMAPLG